jgi:hypothetical protein
MGWASDRTPQEAVYILTRSYESGSKFQAFIVHTVRTGWM